MTHDEIYEGRVARDERNYSSNTSNYSKTPNPIVLHDELVDIAIVKDLNRLIRKQMKAIDAVFELHKPVMSFTGGYDGEENELWAEECRECSCDGFSQMYPCPTIQTIESIIKERS